MEEARYVELTARYLSGEISSPDKAELLAWAEQSPANRKFFDQLIELWSLSGRFDEDTDFAIDLDKAWARLDANLPVQQASIKKLTAIGWMVRVAAAGVLLLIAGYWISGIGKPSLEWVTTQENEQKEVILPDGSRVWVNEESRLAYDPSFKQRAVSLEGEAFFEVARDERNPFTVTSGGAQTTVLGTRFNVRAYADEPRVEVTVESGTVSVEPVSSKGKGVFLNAGNSGVYSKGENKVDLYSRGIFRASTWKTKSLIFQNDRIGDVLPVLERYFDIKIIAKNPQSLNCHFDMNEQDPSLEVCLNTLKFVANFQVEQRGDTIYIDGPSCE